MLVRTGSMVHMHMAAALAAGRTYCHLPHPKDTQGPNQKQRHPAAGPPVLCLQTFRFSSRTCIRGCWFGLQAACESTVCIPDHLRHEMFSWWLQLSEVIAVDSRACMQASQCIWSFQNFRTLSCMAAYCCNATCLRLINRHIALINRPPTAF